MIKWICIFLLALHRSVLQGKLVFEPGSDVGYIVPDSPTDENSDGEIPLSTKYLEEEKVKNEVKRAFWNTVFDDYARVNKLKEEMVQNQRSPKSVLFSTSAGSKNESPKQIPEELRDPQRGVVMGIPDWRCDDGLTNLEMDWDGSSKDFACYTPKQRLAIRKDLAPLETCDEVSDLYRPKHYCMDEAIHYNTSVPTFGPHRPLWAVFGEYQYVPPQRWLHNIEHGSVVMLYHPCTQPLLVLRLKQLVKKCIYKHVISSSMEVSVDRPLVLVAWGCKLEMTQVDEGEVVSFIRVKALQGPEGTLSKQGNYTMGLLEASHPIPGSDIDDSNLCPFY